MAAKTLAPGKSLVTKYASKKSYVPEPDPVVISGAGPSGTVLAHCLRSASVPFQLCEKDSHPNHYGRNKSQPSYHERVLVPTIPGIMKRSRRQYASILKPWAFKPLETRLKIDFHRHLQLSNIDRRVRWAQKTDSIDPDESTVETDPFGKSHLVYVAGFVKKLQIGLGGAHFNHILSDGGIARRGDTVPPAHQKVVNTFQPSLVVGADGLFSPVQRNQFVQKPLYHANMIIYRTTLVLPRSLFDSEIAQHLDEFFTASIKHGNSRIETQVYGLTETEVKLNLWFSRPATPDAEFSRFYGLCSHQRDMSFTDAKFDSSVMAEITKIGPLSKPFEILVDAANNLPIVAPWKTLPSAIRIPKDDLVTAVTARGEAVPAVLIGDAAHSLPHINNPDDLSNSVLDAVQLGDLIVSAYKAYKAEGGTNPSPYAEVPRLFYNIAFSRWQRLERQWEDRFIELYGNADIKLQWTRVTELHRRPIPEHEHTRRLCRFATVPGSLDRENPRWNAAEESRRPRRERWVNGKASETAEMDGNSESKLVLRYTPMCKISFWRGRFSNTPAKC